jgi:PleD family two-component response regulator
VNFSAGVSVLDSHLDSVSALQAADQALYAAKAAGRHCWKLGGDDQLMPANIG